jgi:hypothetical protein
MMWNGCAKDGNVRSEFEEDEGTDCEDGDWHCLVKVDRMWHALHIKCLQWIAKHFYSSMLFMGGHLIFG